MAQGGPGLLAVLSLHPVRACSLSQHPQRALQSPASASWVPIPLSAWPQAPWVLHTECFLCLYFSNPHNSLMW